MDTLAGCFCVVALLEEEAVVEVLLLDILEDFVILDALEEVLGFDATVETAELAEDLLCSLCDSWSKALIACNLEELDNDIND